MKLHWDKIALLAFLFWAGNLVAQAPGAKSASEYQNWVKDEYLPKSQGNYDQIKSDSEDVLKELKDCSKEGEAKNCPKAEYLRGNASNKIKQVADKDAKELKKAFKPCNDNKVRSWEEFFKPDRKMGFSCANPGSWDRQTGNELALLCQQDPLACGVHHDNQHRGVGLSVGLGIISATPTSNPACPIFYVTGTYVQYYFPWVLINSSRQMFQSAYLDEDYVKEARKDNRDILKDKTKAMAEWDLQIDNYIAKNELKDQGYDIDITTNTDNIDQDIKASLDSLDKIDEAIKDTSPHSTHSYARNLSSVLDVEMMNPWYKFVPHIGKDSHRFGTDLPWAENASSARKLPLPYALTSRGNIGGILASRLLGASALMGDEFTKFLGSTSAGGGPFICMRHNMYTGKTPQDLYPNQHPEMEKDTLCLSKIGNRFPLMADSFSLHDTDAFWRSVVMGGLDMFYMLNWPEFVAGTWMAFGAMPYTPYHTFSERYDKFYITKAASDENFVKENEDMGHQCKVLEDMTEYNVNFRKANMHKPKWGGQNTVYIYGLVKGVWGFRGIIPLRVIPRPRNPGVAEVYVRFN